MGLTKQYLAFKPTSIFNIIASGRANISFVTIGGVDGRYVAVAGAENVLVWNTRLGKRVLEMTRDKQEVTYLRPSPDQKHLAVGYTDGVIEIFSLESQQSVCTFAAHRSAISSLNYDLVGLKLVSGGLDNDIVVSDVVAQSGKCRLVGHNAPITGACFMQKYHDVVISCSKDTQIKFWNIDTQSCFKTIVDHRTEVWGIALMRHDDFVVAGSGDTQLTVYKIVENNKEHITEPVGELEEILLESEASAPFRCTQIGNIQRSGFGRTINLIAESNGQILGCHGTDRKIELFYFCTAEESLARLTKRLKKLDLKSKVQDSITSTTNAPERQLSLTDEIKRLPAISVSDKIKSFDLLLGNRNDLRVCVTYVRNLVQIYMINVGEKHAEASVIQSIRQQGHLSEARSVTFSSDNLAIASASGESLKLWNRASQSCLRTIETGYVLSSCFVPGDRHVLVGLKTGELLIIDIVTGEVIEKIAAHEKELWSIVLTPDMRGCVTGGGDTTVKFWSFELIADPNREDNSEVKVLSLLHKNVLKLEETVLCVRISRNGKYIAVALLDSTVKIFFLDSLKFYLSLYGHKLPVLCMDISYDSTLIVTGSADRSIKIWGMDFGDCHRSLIAHDNTVTGLEFIPKTHMFFSCGKDGKLKQWDADSFEKIVTLPGHVGEAHSLAISPNGKFVVSCGSDRTLRLFERTDETLVLQDVQEEEREELENVTLATGDDSSVPGLPGLKLPSKKTIGSEKAAENILECLEVSKKFEQEDSKNIIPPLMCAYEATNTDDFLLAVLMRIRASDLEEALLLLPFASVCEILERIPKLTQTRQDHTEIICKVVLFLFRIHQKPIVSNQMLLPVIQDIIGKLQRAIVELRDMIGVNYHGMQMLQREVEANQGVDLFRDATKSKRAKDKKRRRKELTKRTFVQIST
ncbi:WD repeat-containing protein 3 [Toxorhynchites rutilus septentrionalis]|uniref:WD repeat-containing protein 3 n=1 Tax=Toxorhynchites rutilus septentrionalis TaxID=329112 RepID=UPI00247942EE|nr:WD repeat-containing protein 3 [Toxorhynchites rutilus septentrionalis]